MRVIKNGKKLIETSDNTRSNRVREIGEGKDFPKLNII